MLPATPRAALGLLAHQLRFFRASAPLAADLRRPRKRQWPVKPRRARSPPVDSAALASPLMNTTSLLDRDVTAQRAQSPDFELSADVQQAMSIEVEALRDQIWGEFHREHSTFSEALDAELQRRLQDAYRDVRARWTRVQLALDGDDEALKSRAQQQLKAATEGRLHFNPDIAQRLRHLERQLPPEASDYLRDLKLSGRPAEITQEDIDLVLRFRPDGEPVPPPNADSSGAGSLSSSSATSSPKPETPERSYGMSFDHFYELLQSEYTEMVRAGQLPRPDAHTVSPADLDHHRRLLRWEMEQDPQLVQMLEHASGVPRDQLLEEVLQAMAGPDLGDSSGGPTRPS